jgi:hypothetical protein
MFINFYFIDGDKVIKCRAGDENKDFFLDMGAKLSEEQAKDHVRFNEFMKDPQPLPSGNSGSGEYGSNEWHTNQINGFDTKEEVTAYTDNIDCRDYDKRGGLDIVKDKAIKALSND